MNTDTENWIEEHYEENEFWESVKWIEKEHPGVYAQFVKDLKEHSDGCKHDPYYRYTYGAGRVPVPCCAYCSEFDKSKEACTLEWNNLDENYYISDRDDRDGSDLCDKYEWDGTWEDD